MSLNKSLWKKFPESCLIANSEMSLWCCSLRHAAKRLRYDAWYVESVDILSRCWLTPGPEPLSGRRTAAHMSLLRDFRLVSDEACYGWPGDILPICLASASAFSVCPVLIKRFFRRSLAFIAGVTKYGQVISLLEKSNFATCCVNAACWSGEIFR